MPLTPTVFVLYLASVWSGGAAAEHVGLCSLPCPMMSSFSADVSVVRQGVTPSTDDYTAVGKVGITHELLMGCIVYAIDVQVTYGASKPIRKWFAGWNFMGQSAHRYFVVQPQGDRGSCHFEKDSHFSSDPFTAMLDRFARARPTSRSTSHPTEQYTTGETGETGDERWDYEWAFSGHTQTANCATASGGAPIKESHIETFQQGIGAVGTINTSYSNFGTKPSEALFWPIHAYPDCASHALANFTTTGQSSICLNDVLALEYGCM